MESHMESDDHVTVDHVTDDHVTEEDEDTMDIPRPSVYITESDVRGIPHNEPPDEALGGMLDSTDLDLEDELDEGHVDNLSDPPDHDLHEPFDGRDLTEDLTRRLSSPMKKAQRDGYHIHLPSLVPGSADIPRIPSPSHDIKYKRELSLMTRQSARARFPSKVRMTSVSSRSKTAAPSVYYEDPYKKRKVITWDQAHNHRPPLRVDMEGPTCWTYTPRNKPLTETNSPCYSFGRKCLPEKSGGSRTSNEKVWFQSPHIWVQKADFHSDRRWPTPAHYETRLTIGSRQATYHQTPCYTMGYKRGVEIAKYGAEDEPSPTHYNKEKADKHVMRSAPSLSHSWRYTGTNLWGGKEKTPGPGAYNPQQSASYTKPHYPSFSIRGIRGHKRQELGPFSSF